MAVCLFRLFKYSCLWNKSQNPLEGLLFKNYVTIKMEPIDILIKNIGLTLNNKVKESELGLDKINKFVKIDLFHCVR